MEGSLTCVQLILTDATCQLRARGPTGDWNLDMGTFVTMAGHFCCLSKPEL